MYTVFFTRNRMHFGFEEIALLRIVGTDQGFFKGKR